MPGMIASGGKLVAYSGKIVTKDIRYSLTLIGWGDSLPADAPAGAFYGATYQYRFNSGSWSSAINFRPNPTPGVTVVMINNIPSGTSVDLRFGPGVDTLYYYEIEKYNCTSNFLGNGPWLPPDPATLGSDIVNLGTISDHTDIDLKWLVVELP